jgi:O-antigen/teichoic acid export membrane protein
LSAVTLRDARRHHHWRRGSPPLSHAVNITANAVSRIWLAILQVIATPIIVSLLGPDSYGLVGFSVTITLFLVFLDQCVSPVLSRELVRIGQDREWASEARNLLRTLELVSIATGLLVGGLITLAAPWIARHGIASGKLPESVLIGAVRLIGLGIATQWPGMLYGGGFVGLQRQDILVAIRSLGGTVSAVGGVLLLWLVSPSIELYLGWIAFMALILSGVQGIVLWRMMPSAKGPARGDAGIAARLWRFSAGNLLIGLFGSLLTQTPGLIIAKYCTLSQLAAYTLSFTLAQQVSTMLTQPVTSTLIPHFAQLIYRGDEATLAREYHRWTQIIVALVLPVAATLIVFAQPLMRIWLGPQSPLVDPVSELLPLIAIGSLFQTVVTPFYLIQIAAGSTRLTAASSVVAVAVTLPTLLILVPRVGPVAAAGCWIAVNLGYYLFAVPLMHSRLLRDELWRWWLMDTLLPMIVVALVFTGSSLLIPPSEKPWWGFLQGAATASIAVCAISLVFPKLRRDAFAAACRLIAGLTRSLRGS